MPNITAKYQDPLLVKDPQSERFYICSTFEIYYLLLIDQKQVICFKYFCRGSIFICQALDQIVDNIVQKDFKIAKEKLKEINNVVHGHKYIDWKNQCRFNQFIEILVNKLP